MVGIQPQHLAEAVHGLRRLPLPLLRQCQTEPGFGAAWMLGHRLAGRLFTLAETSRLKMLAGLAQLLPQLRRLLLHRRRSRFPGSADDHRITEMVAGFAVRLCPDGRLLLHFRREGRGHACKDLLPVARVLLAEQAHGGIPGSVFAILQPAPVTHQGNAHPDGNTQGARQVGQGAVAADHQVEVAHHRRDLDKLAIQPATQIGDGKLTGQLFQLLDSLAQLQAEQTHVVYLGQRSKTTQGHGAQGIIGMFGVALPDDADLEHAQAGPFPLPGLNPSWIGMQIGRFARNALQFRAQEVRQTQQRCMHVVGRQRALARQDLVDARTGTKEADQRGRTDQQDGASVGLDQGSVPHKLERVADALLAVQQDGLAGQAGAVPEWLRRAQRQEILACASAIRIRTSLPGSGRA